MGLRWGDLQHGRGAFLLGASSKQLRSCILHNSFLTLRFPSSKGSHNRPGAWPSAAAWPVATSSPSGLQVACREWFCPRPLERRKKAERREQGERAMAAPVALLPVFVVLGLLPLPPGHEQLQLMQSPGLAWFKPSLCFLFFLHKSCSALGFPKGLKSVSLFSSKSSLRVLTNS